MNCKPVSEELDRVQTRVEQYRQRGLDLHALATDRAVLRQVVRDLPEGERRSVVRDVMEYAAFVQEEGQGQGEFAAFLAQQFHEMEPLREPFAPGRSSALLYSRTQPGSEANAKRVYAACRDTGDRWSCCSL